MTLRWLGIGCLFLGVLWRIDLHSMRVEAACDRALWVWGSVPALTAEERGRLFDFAAARCIDRLYQESQTLLGKQPETLTVYLSEAASRGLQVELLFGAADWALAVKHATPLNLAESAVTYIQTLTPTLRPVGLHFDIEPHILPEWDSDINATANQYLDLLEKLATCIHDGGMRLAVDIPFWYDNRLVTRHDQTRPLSEWVIERVDQVTLMAYRDHAEPPDGLIDLTETEMNFAQGAGKQVVIGVETNCSLSPAKITFCEEGSTVLDQALRQTQTFYASHSAFGGFAVHDYQGYQALARKPTHSRRRS